MKRYKLKIDVRKAYADVNKVSQAIAMYKDSNMAIEIENFDYLLTFGERSVTDFINALPLKDDQDAKIDIYLKLDYVALSWYIYHPNGSLGLIEDLLKRKVILEVDNLPFNMIIEIDRLVELGVA